MSLENMGLNVQDVCAAGMDFAPPNRRAVELLVRLPREGVTSCTSMARITNHESLTRSDERGAQEKRAAVFTGVGSWGALK